MDTIVLRRHQSCRRTLAQVLLMSADLAIDNHASAISPDLQI